MPSTPHLSQPPVHSPDLISVFEANFGRLPPNGEQLLVPYPPHPARLHPLGELLGLSNVSLHETSSPLPFLHLLDVCPREQMPLRNLSAHLVPGRGYERTGGFNRSVQHGRFWVLSGPEVRKWRGWVVQEGCPRRARGSCGSGGGPGSP